jgi:UDP-N-acetylglucosamine--N-acetylmuramyl-(pentapeptide) pyrophosphoryl-undecaprenol N-acetylglucosamine transferase
LGAACFLHESNTVPGRANRWLGRWADEIFVGFKIAGDGFKNRKTRQTGTPVRPEFKPVDSAGSREALGLRPGDPVLLIMGGSQGAQRLNEIAIEAVGLLKKRDVQFKVIHLSGRADEEMVKKAYKKLGVSAETHAFLKNISAAYAVADLAVCRSGAASCSELAIAAVPALFVPFPTSMNNHQLANAKSYEKAGAANIIEEKDLDADKLADYLEDCSKDSGKLSEMKNAMYKLANPDAVDKLADLVEKTGSTE